MSENEKSENGGNGNASNRPDLPAEGDPAEVGEQPPAVPPEGGDPTGDKPREGRQDAVMERLRQIGAKGSEAAKRAPDLLKEGLTALGLEAGEREEGTAIDHERLFWSRLGIGVVIVVVIFLLLRTMAQGPRPPEAVRETSAQPPVAATAPAPEEETRPTTAAKPTEAKAGTAAARPSPKAEAKPAVAATKIRDGGKGGDLRERVERLRWAHEQMGREIEALRQALERQRGR